MADNAPAKSTRKRAKCCRGRGNNVMDKGFLRVTDGITIATAGGVSMMVRTPSPVILSLALHLPWLPGSY